jgi:hypothetical protein
MLYTLCNQQNKKKLHKRRKKIDFWTFTFIHQISKKNTTDQKLSQAKNTVLSCFLQRLCIFFMKNKLLYFQLVGAGSADNIDDDDVVVCCCCCGYFGNYQY